MESEYTVSLKDLEDQANAAINKKTKVTSVPTVLEPRTVDNVESENEESALVPVDELPAIEKSKGGGHLSKGDSDTLSAKDLEVLSLLACGVDKTVTANLVGIDRRTIYKLLDSERVERLTKGAKKRLASLAPLAVEIIHSELVKGNIEVAQSVLKGLAIMKTSVNTNGAKEKITSIAEEIVENNGKTTKRLTRSQEIND